MIKTKDYALQKIESILVYLTMEQWGLPEREQERWDALHAAIIVMEKCKKIVKESESGA